MRAGPRRAEGRRFRRREPRRRRAGAQGALRRPRARLLHPCPRQPWCQRKQAARSRPVLGDLRPGARRDGDDRLRAGGPPGRGRARQGAVGQGLHADPRHGLSLQRGRPAFAAARRHDAADPHRRQEHGKGAALPLRARLLKTARGDSAAVVGRSPATVTRHWTAVRRARNSAQRRSLSAADAK